MLCKGCVMCCVGGCGIGCVTVTYLSTRFRWSKGNTLLGQILASCVECI